VLILPKLIGSCRVEIARLEVIIEENDLQKRRIAANILNKQAWTVEIEWSSSLDVKRGSYISSL